MATGSLTTCSLLDVILLLLQPALLASEVMDIMKYVI